MDLSNYLQNKKFTKGSQRNDILRQIYSFYDSDREVFLTKKKNWKRYIEFLKENKLKDTKENQDRFKKSKKFIKKMSPSTVVHALRLPSIAMKPAYEQVYGFCRFPGLPQQQCILMHYR